MRTCTWIVLMVSLSLGCRTHMDPAPVDRRTLAAISLPDFSSIAPQVRDQINTQRELLTRVLTNPSTADKDLADAFGELGILLMAAEYRPAAEPSFRNAETIAPADPRWPYYLAHLYRMEGDLASSAAQLQRALHLQPRSIPALVWLASVDIDLGSGNEAEPLLKQALTLDPQSTAALYGLGRIALARRDYRDAVTLLEHALAIDKGRSRIQYQLALAYQGLGESEKSRSNARESGLREIEPSDPLLARLGEVLNSAKAYEVRGERAQLAGDTSTAIQDFTKAVELAPNDPSPRQHLGTVLYLNGDASGAIEQFNRAVSVSPRFAKAHYSLGVISGSRGQTDVAIRELQVAVEDDPNYMAARLALADVLRTAGRWQTSAAEYQRCLTLEPDRPEAALGYAIVLAHAGRYADARDTLAHAHTTHPDHSPIAYALSRLLAAAPDDSVRDGRRALATLETLLPNQPRTVDLAEAMAMAAAEVGQYGEAITWQKDAIRGANRAGLSDLVIHMNATLRLYAARRPSRVPWVDNEDLLGVAALTVD